MNRYHFVLGVAVVIVVGLGVGFGVSRWKAPDAPPPREPSPEASLQVALGPAERPRAAEPSPGTEATVSGKRALLIGVTKYDNLRQDKHLAGPANDVLLMRRLLQERYQFPADNIVTLSEDKSTPALRPIRANIEREFRRLADEAGEGDQIVILLAGHGARQPESDPPDPNYPEPDGIDEIFLPADVRMWKGYPDRVPNAIRGGEFGAWLSKITSKKAHVWIIFDCCHSGTMTRGTEVARELPPNFLVPQEELEKARKRAAQRSGKTRGDPPPKLAPFVPRKPSDYLVALYACREYETTPESPQPPERLDAKWHGLLTYSLVGILEKSAASKAPLTYRELVQRLQVRYAARPEGSPTPLGEGKSQNRVVLGTDQPSRPRLLLSRDKDGYKVSAGDLYGLTKGSILAVYSPAGTDEEPKLLGHVRVGAVQPFEATVEPCPYEKSPLTRDLAPLSTCQPVFIDYGLRRFKVAVQVPPGQAATRQKLLKALEPLTSVKEGLVEKVEDLQQAEWLIRLDKDKLQLVEASGNRAPFALPALDSPDLADALRKNLEKVYRARNLIAISNKFEEQRYRGSAAVNVEVEVLRHKSEKAPGEVWPRPADGWVFRPGDLISFRVHNKSPSLKVDVTLLIIGSDFEIQPFYPKRDEVGRTLNPEQSLDTPPPPGEIGNDPPFGPECLVVIAVPAKNPPADFTALAQDGLVRARSADLQSPLGQLLESAMFRTGSRSTLSRGVAEQHGMRVLTWKTEPK
jgi:hypothetical protein